MAPTKKATSLLRRRWLFLLPVPLIWCALSHFNLLQFLETRLLDLRFRYRGEIAAPVNVRYVDIDGRAIHLLGERPWDRGDFGVAAKALMEAGGAKAIGFDIVFSNLAASKMVSRDEFKKRNLEFGRVTRVFPTIVLGAQYSNTTTHLTENTLRQFPLLRLGFRDRKKNDVPEQPEFPIAGSALNRATGKMIEWGTMALIDADEGFGGDDVPRWVPLFAHTPNPTFYALALRLALIELGLDESAVRLDARKLDLVRPGGAVAISIPLTAEQLVEVNWFSEWDNFALNPRDSLADVLLNAKDLTSEKPAARAEAKAFFAQFKDAIILVGPTEKLIHDLAPAPFDTGAVPKVGMHGNLLKTILTQKFLTRFPEWVTFAITLGLTLLVSPLAAAGGRGGLRAKLTAALLIVAYVFLAFWLFKHHHLVLPLAAPLAAAFSTSFVAIGWQLIVEEKQKGRITGMFGTYVSPQLVERMVDSGDDPRLGGHEENITAYFSDIQGFSTFSEKLPPEKLVELMNEYLTACTDLVQAEGGTLDKFIGDAVVAMFGAPVALPDHALRACVATQRVHLKLAELREKWRSEGDKWPEIVWRMQSRIGLNSGPCIVGNMGSRDRFNYTMMGDNVNLAARMESGSKSWGVYSMCADATRLACETHGAGRLVFRPLGRIVVKGRSLAVPVHEIVGLKENVSARTHECLGFFAAALEKYYARDWAGAAALFAQSRDLEPNIPGQTPGVVSNPSLVYLEKILPETLEEPPSADWDGRYVMKEK
jgi:adenylate cyclase